MELKIEDLKVGDSLVCIDSDGFINGQSPNVNKGILKHPIIISHFGEYGAYLTVDFWLEEEELKYFKKKEQSQQCTFEEIVSEARTALDKGLLKSLYQADRTLSCVSVKGDNTILVQSGIIQSDAFDFIQSLYKETFVIKDDSDLLKIKWGECNAVLINGESLELTREIGKLKHDICMSILKGATVTQSK